MNRLSISLSLLVTAIHMTKIYLFTLNHLYLTKNNLTYKKPGPLVSVVYSPVMVMWDETVLNCPES